MTIDQKQKVVAQLEQFWQLDIDKRLGETYKDYQDLDSTLIGSYSVNQFGLFSKKAISQLGQMLNSSLCNLMPFTYQFQNDFGGGTLADDVSGLIAHATGNDFNNAVLYLYRLVYYQIQNGFWSKEEPIDEHEKEEILTALEERLNLISHQLSTNLELNKTLIDELTAEKEAIQNLISTKNKELAEISSLLPTARGNSEEIIRLLTASTDNNQAINGLLNQQKANLDDIKARLVEERDAFTKNQDDVKSLKDQYSGEIAATTKQNEDFVKLLESVKTRSSTFDDRLKVLNELIGKEGAVKLFSTFNDRKGELSTPVRRWAYVVFGTGVVALGLIIGIFTNFYGLIGNGQQSVDGYFLVINSLKSLPIMVVLFFTIRQYMRERNFQEEYAFRSTIALTIQAYADIAGSRKEELIMNAVNSIYAMPTMMKEKSSSLFGVRSKALTDTLKELNETMRNAKS